MRRDPQSGLLYVWRCDGEGRAFRDFTIGGQVDDRFEVDEATGEIVQVRDKVSHQLLDFADDEDGVDAAPASVTNGHALDIASGPSTSHRRRPPLASVLKAARAQGATRVRTPDGYTVDLTPTTTNEDTGDDIDRLLDQHKRKSTNGRAQKKT